jgi:hypothetical protein
MASCRTVEFLYRAFPLRVFRDRLIRTHLETCEHCRARLLSREEARSLFVRPGDVEPIDGLWRMIADQAVRLPAAPVRASGRRAPRLRWATAAAAALIVVVTGFWLLDQVQKAGPDAESAARDAGFRLEYVHIGGAPAQTFVFKPLGSDTVFVWAQRAP